MEFAKAGRSLVMGIAGCYRWGSADAVRTRGAEGVSDGRAMTVSTRILARSWQDRIVHEYVGPSSFAAADLRRSTVAVRAGGGSS